MKADFIEIVNEKTSDTAKSGKGRKLTAKESTFCIDEGSYKGTITDAFWYKTAEDRDRVMFVFELEDGTEFKNSVDGDWVENYPFSKLISQANIEYVEDFKGLKVQFTVRNTEGDTVTFSNIKKISLDE
ncbi:MAG: hypothetical protein E7504_04300 [Ruminococcus sp.]|nr:hypothetical protein [Ruminococcus sp.]